MAVSRTAGAAARGSHAESPGRETATKKPWWTRTWAIVSAIVGILGTVTGVIGVWPLIFRDATTLDSLTIEVESAESPFSSMFAVPATAPWESFPTSSSFCDPAQRSWLETHGVLLERRFLVSVANTAQEGAMLSLKDFRGSGDVASTPPTHIAVVCDETGGGESGIRSALVDPASGRTAVYVQPDPTLPDNPLVFNLAPGENGQFALLVESSADFSGGIVFTEALGGATREVLLPLGGDLEQPGVAPIRFAVVDGDLACVGVEGCVPDDVIRALSGAA